VLPASTREPPRVQSQCSEAPLVPAAPKDAAAAAPEDQRESLGSAASDQARKSVSEFAESTKSSPTGGALSPMALRLKASALDGKASGNAAATRNETLGVHGSLTGNALNITTPGGLTSPTPATEDGVTTSLDAHGLTVDVNGAPRADGQGTFTDGASLDVSRASATVSVSRTRAGESRDVALYLDTSTVDVSTSTRWEADGRVHSRSADLGFTRNAAFVAVSGSDTNPAGNTIKRSAQVLLSADRAVADLGAYEGDDPRLKGKRQVQLTRSLAGGLDVGSGIKLPTFGIGGRLVLDKGRDVTFTTFLGTARARAVLTEGGGALGFIRNKARAVGAALEPLVVPDLANPSTMKVGDQLTVKTSGTLMAGVALGAATVTAGVQVEMRGEFELTARKLSDTQIELSVNPRNLRGVQIFADTGYLLDVGHTHSKGEGFRQSFTFDLSNPAAAAAYQAALQGELPNGLNSKTLPKEEAALATLVRDEKLPGGVTRNLLERADVTASTTGGGLNWGPLQSEGGIAGLSYRRSKVEGRSVITNGDASLTTESRGVERRREVLLSGTETDGVSASVRTVTLYDTNGVGTRAFEGLHLRAHFSDDRVKGLELNDEVLDRVNGAFGTQLPHFERAGRKQSREISVTRIMTPEDLLRLTTVNPAAVRDAATAAEVKEKPLAALVTSLKSIKNPEAQATLVKDYVAEQGLDGFGAIHRLLGGADALRVQTSSNAYTRPAAAAELLALKYDQPISATDSADLVTARFEAVLPVRRTLLEAQLDLDDDKLVTKDERAAIARSLDAADEKLDGVLDVKTLPAAARARIHDEIAGGWWTTSTETQVMEHLSEAGLG